MARLVTHQSLHAYVMHGAAPHMCTYTSHPSIPSHTANANVIPRHPPIGGVSLPSLPFAQAEGGCQYTRQNDNESHTVVTFRRVLLTWATQREECVTIRADPSAALQGLSLHVADAAYEKHVHGMHQYMILRATCATWVVHALHVHSAAVSEARFQEFPVPGSRLRWMADKAH
eukprot:366130-Chlamydomonas_euryale.AAC.65